MGLEGRGRGEGANTASLTFAEGRTFDSPARAASSELRDIASDQSAQSCLEEPQARGPEQDLRQGNILFRARNRATGQRRTDRGQLVTGAG